MLRPYLGVFFVLFLVKRLSLLFCLVFGVFFFLPWQSPWFESAVKPSATELTFVSGCSCHPYLPRAGGWVRYDFWELTCCQLFPFEEAGDGGIAPCTASPGGEVVKVSALPGSVLQAGLTRAFTAVHKTPCVALSGWWRWSWDAPAVGREDKEIRVGKQSQGRLQRAGLSPPASARWAESNCCWFWPHPPAATWLHPMGLAQREQAVWPLSLRCQQFLPFSQSPWLQSLPGLQVNGGQPHPTHQERWHCHLPQGAQGCMAMKPSSSHSLLGLTVGSRSQSCWAPGNSSGFQVAEFRKQTLLEMWTLWHPVQPTKCSSSQAHWPLAHPKFGQTWSFFTSEV